MTSEKMNSERTISLTPNENNELRDPTLNAVLDAYLTNGRIDAEAYASLTYNQREVIQAIKRSIKRIIKKQHANKSTYTNEHTRI